jgi:hypothetical protein
MSRRTGFTLVELLASAAILTLSLGQLGQLLNARELSRRALCKSNLSRIGMGLAIYTSNNRDKFPWLTSSDEWSAATGAAREQAPSAKTNYNVSALLFMLVRDGQDANRFVCPSTQDTVDPQTASAKKEYHWDFSPFTDGNAEHLSYSYQAPLMGEKGTGSGVSANSESGLVIVADRTPAYAGLKPDFDWAKPGKDDPNTGMSQNHSRGQMINLLYADLHVGESIGRANCGIHNDNIYSAAGMGADGKPQDINEGPGSMKLSDHRSKMDSFLIGPVKMEKAANDK